MERKCVVSRISIRNRNALCYNSSRLAAWCVEYFKWPGDFLGARPYPRPVLVTDDSIDVLEGYVEALLESVAQRIHNEMQRRGGHPSFVVRLEVPLASEDEEEEGVVKGARLSLEVRFPNMREYSKCARCVRIVGSASKTAWPGRFVRH